MWSCESPSGCHHSQIYKININKERQRFTMNHYISSAGHSADKAERPSLLTLSPTSIINWSCFNKIKDFSSGSPRERNVWRCHHLQKTLFQGSDPGPGKSCAQNFKQTHFEYIQIPFLHVSPSPCYLLSILVLAGAS